MLCVEEKGNKHKGDVYLYVRLVFDEQKGGSSDSIARDISLFSIHVVAVPFKLYMDIYIENYPTQSFIAINSYEHKMSRIDGCLSLIKRKKKCCCFHRMEQVGSFHRMGARFCVCVCGSNPSPVRAHKRTADPTAHAAPSLFRGLDSNSLAARSALLFRGQRQCLLQR